MDNNELKKFCDYAIRIAIATGEHPYFIMRENISLFINDVEKKKEIYKMCIDFLKSNYDEDNYRWRFY